MKIPARCPVGRAAGWACNRSPSTQPGGCLQRGGSTGEESGRFTRRDILNIKPGFAAEAGRIFKDEVIPLLRGLKGMRHDDILISPVLSEAALNNCWDSQERAVS